ncbi:MAG: ferritin [Ignavibacteria bacterium]|nr:ferritin [Ignavibacteria bacterium]
MISAKMEKVLNEQINEELFSSYLYLSMASYFENTKYTGFAQWMRIQSHEEYEHAMKFFEFIIELGGKVTLAAIEKPKAKWTSPKNAFEEALKHELHITDKINKLADLAIEEKNHAVGSFLKWFVDEQVEEVSHAQGIVDKFDLIGDSKGSLFMLDRELGKRSKD